MPAPDALALLDGHCVHELALLILYEPARQAVSRGSQHGQTDGHIVSPGACDVLEQAAPAVEKVPGAQAVSQPPTAHV